MKNLFVGIACLTFALSLNTGSVNAQRSNRSLWNSFVQGALQELGSQTTQRILDSIFGTSSKANTAQASNRDIACIVTDPTDTPLNVRSTPNNPVIVGTLPNGGRVIPYRIAYDEKNRYWILIGNKTEVWGWVFGSYLSCSLNS